MQAIAFDKYQGLGNDFVLVEGTEKTATPTLARAVCDRRLGVGGDGLLVVTPPRTSSAVARMIVVNADGSIPEMCGNGLRCVALHLARVRGLRGELVVETDAGPLACRVDETEIVTVDMGIVRFVEDVTIDLDGEAWELSLGDAGNPHAITTRAVTRAVIDAIGPRLATHPRFERGTNVEFATLKARNEIDLVVWERGVGITHACGTGACATVAVAEAKGWCPPGTEVFVRLPGGVLSVTMKDGHAIMRGPAKHVFRGTYAPPDHEVA
jgi:diaminopimelate epimerase